MIKTYHYQRDKYYQFLIYQFLQNIELVYRDSRVQINKFPFQFV